MNPRYSLQEFTEKMANEFGIDSQDHKLFEELNELMVALYNWKMCHIEEERYISLGDVILEIADVRLTLEQFERNHSIQALVKQKMDFKQQRTEERYEL